MAKEEKNLPKLTDNDAVEWGETKQERIIEDSPRAAF